MGLIVNKADFIGTFKLSQSIADEIDAYIDQYETSYLVKLLGVELYKAFKADYDSAPAGEPTAQIYKDIFDPILEDVGSWVLESKGIKFILLGFIWFEYVRIEKYKHTGVGAVEMRTELADNANWQNGFIYKRYNESVKSVGAVQYYICDNSGDYPDYNGQKMELSRMF